MKRVAIMTDRPGWHSAEIRRAFRAHGVEARYVSLTQCQIDLQARTDGLVIPGFTARLPDGVMVRSIPGGTLEQVTLRLDFLHALGELGVPVCNSARTIERSVDKAMTSWLLARAGVPTPPAWVTETATQARAILIRETAAGNELVAKPLFGSQGEGLLRLDAGSDIPEPRDFGGLWYMQRFVPSARGAWCDWRVFVIGGSAVAAMARHGRSWINNVARGARCESTAIDDVMGRLAVDAVRAVGMDYAGVDIMRDARGNLTVIEVNSIPSWKGLQRVTELNIAQRLVDEFIQRRISPRLEAVC
jgi:RimK family alpha-L-glutamate ligase